VQNGRRRVWLQSYCFLSVCQHAWCKLLATVLWLAS
jgi:hypothetical protein